MSFNAQEYLAGIGPPEYTDTRGKTHVGRVISFRQWLPIQQLVNAVAKTDEPPSAQVMAMILRRMTKRMFPRPLLSRLLGPFHYTVTKDIMNLPPAAQLEVFKDFLAAQNRSLGLTPTKLEQDAATEAA